MGAARAAALSLSYLQRLRNFCQSGEAIQLAVLLKLLLRQQVSFVALSGTNVAFQL